jgi:putative ABC transport system permease protein
VTTIPMINVALAFVPVLVMLAVMFWWSLAISDSVVAVGRMLIQLVVIGYALIWIFEVDSPLLVLGLLTTMLLIASSIALRPLAEHRAQGDYARALLSIACEGGLTLAFMTYFVLTLDPW